MSVKVKARRAAVYCAYDKAGMLLYVGMSVSPRTRMYQHAANTGWWKLLVARTEVTWFDSQMAASNAERQAIELGQPKMNHRGVLSAYARPYMPGFEPSPLPPSWHRYLSLKQVAERAGMNYNTAKSNVQRALRNEIDTFPKPDCQMGEHDPEGGGRQVTYGWLERTIDDWLKTREQ